MNEASVSESSGHEHEPTQFVSRNGSLLARLQALGLRVGVCPNPRHLFIVSQRACGGCCVRASE